MKWRNSAPIQRSPGLFADDADLKGMALEVGDPAATAWSDGAEHIGAHLVVAPRPDDRDVLWDREGDVIGDDGGGGLWSPSGELGWRRFAMKQPPPRITLFDECGLHCHEGSRLHAGRRRRRRAVRLGIGVVGCHLHEPLQVGVLDADRGGCLASAVPVLTVL